MSQYQKGLWGKSLTLQFPKVYCIIHAKLENSKFLKKNGSETDHFFILKWCLKILTNVVPPGQSSSFLTQIKS